jgi:hypothetical protein
MMTSRDRVIRALCHEPIDRAPRDLWASPATEMLRGDELAEMGRRYPNDIVRPDFRSPRGHRARGAPYEAGEHTDAWGCTWESLQRGTRGRLVHSPLADLGQLAAYRPPLELLEKASFAAVNRGCAATSRFVLAWTDVRPLERLEWLRGSEAALVDLESGAKPIRDLLAMLHDFYCREIAIWAATDVDGVVFSDALGSGEGLRLPPHLFRDLLKPLYGEYCSLLRAQDKFAFFHADGNLESILGDLVEIGLDAVHAQLLSMNLDRLGAQVRNRITFWGDVDDGELLSSGTVDDVKAAVRRLRSVLDSGRGGVIAQCSWVPGAPFRNIAAVFEQWLAPLPAHAHAK